jgi:hypothetical protein
MLINYRAVRIVRATFPGIVFASTPADLFQG